MTPEPNRAKMATELTGIRYDSVVALRDAHAGHFCEKKCPKCGSMMLRNKLGDEWCSFIECDFGIEQPHPKPITCTYPDPTKPTGLCGKPLSRHQIYIESKWCEGCHEQHCDS